MSVRRNGGLVKRKLKSGSVSYSARFWSDVDQRNKVVALGTKNKRVALSKMENLIDEDQQVAQGLKCRTSLVSNTSPYTALENLIVDLQAKDRSPIYIASVKLRLTHALDFFQFDSISQLAPHGLDKAIKFFVKLKASSPSTGNSSSDGTIAQYARHLNQFGRYLVAQSYLTKNPFLGIQQYAPVNKLSREAHVLSPEDIALIAESAPERSLKTNDKHTLEQEVLDQGKQRGRIYFVAGTLGMRLSALRNLKWSDVDQAHGELVIRANTNRKTRKERRLPLKLVMQTLQDQKIFMTQHLGRPVTDMDSVFLVIADITKHFQKDCAHAGFCDVKGNTPSDTKITFHSLRHSCATTLARFMPIKDLSVFLGHSSINTTAKYYLHESKDLWSDALDKAFESSPKSKILKMGS